MSHDYTMAEAARMHLALRNVLAYARRMAKRAARTGNAEAEADAGHLIRFCAEAGVVPTIIRGAK